MKVHFVAQSGFIIEYISQKISIDLWANNPINPISLDKVPKIDHVFVTHDHGDHDLNFGMEIAKRDNATFHSSYEITYHASKNGVIKMESANIGGQYKSGKIEVILTHADHSSDTGIPVGFIIKIGDRTLYHMGDTAYFKGLDFLAGLYKIDTLFIPIGSRYTMGPIEASYAVRDINPKVVIPMHYNTTESIKQDPNIFADLCKEGSPGSKVVIFEPGEVKEI
jgi:L-ascorbate metabolism protein UlaG (beta-lactamase superfamily)